MHENDPLPGPKKEEMEQVKKLNALYNNSSERDIPTDPSQSQKEDYGSFVTGTTEELLTQILSSLPSKLGKMIMYFVQQDASPSTTEHLKFKHITSLAEYNLSLTLKLERIPCSEETSVNEQDSQEQSVGFERFLLNVEQMGLSTRLSRDEWYAIWMQKS